MYGFLNMVKPAGMTSHAVVARVRRLTGIRQIGHAGTLDPDATGVLPLAVGTATRLLMYAQLLPKVYTARVAIGTSTHSGDAGGRVVARSRVWTLSLDDVKDAAEWLQGHVWQIPPQVSALKMGGRRHYQRVHEQEVVWPQPRRISIDSIEAIRLVRDGWEFRAVVGSGSYIRALVRDWADILGVAGHLASLQRVQVGVFVQDAATTLEGLESLGSAWQERLVPWQRVIALDATVSLDRASAERIGHGDMHVLEQIARDCRGVIGLQWKDQLLAIAEGPPWRYRVVL